MNRKKDFKGDPEQTHSNLEFLIKLTEWKNSQKINLSDPDQVKQRLNDYIYLARDCKTQPTIGDLEIVLGIPREYVYMIVSGNYYGHRTIQNLPREVQEAIRDTYHIIVGNVEKSLATGAINPVSGIFLAKSFGIKDTNDIMDVQTPKETPDLERLKTQYLHQLPDREGD